jgi:putative polyketide hydroxylase
MGVAQAITGLTGPIPEGVVIAWRSRLNGTEFGEISLGQSEEMLRLLSLLSPERLSVAGQHMFEPLLAEAAGEMGAVTIRLGAEVVSLAVGDDKVTADYIESGGTRRTVTARYVIGADGVRSIVRRTLGIGEHGQESLGTAINVQFDADLDRYLAGRIISIIWIANKDTQGAFIRDSPTRWRYNFEIPPEADPQAVTQERCEQEIIQAIGEEVPVRFHYMWSWTHDLAVADTWRQGRAFLAGDSAHHFPPHGGFGLNSGVQDIHNLAWKLIARLRWSAGDRLLDSYQAERIGVAEANGELCMNNTRAMEKTGFLTQDKSFLASIEAETEEGERTRKSIADGISEQQQVLANDGHQFGFQYDSTAVVPDGSQVMVSTIAEYRPTARPGARAPHSWVMWQGRQISTVDVYDGGFILLTGPDGTGWTDAAARIGEELGLPLKSFVLGRDLAPVDEPVSDLLGRYGLQPAGALLIRPAGFVGFRSAARSDDEYTRLRDALSQILDLTEAR